MISSHARAASTGVILIVCALFVVGCPPSLLSPNVTRTTDLVYGLGYVEDESADLGYSLRTLRFDLLEPTDVEPVNRPAVLMIHGGNFEGGSKSDEDLVNAANGLATEGYVCFLIDYRVARDEPPVVSSWNPDANAAKDLQIPSLPAVRAAFVDAKTAMRHIRANSDTYGIDPARIAVWGESAGAFAALAAGLTSPAEFSNDGEDFPVPAQNNPGVDSTPAVIVDCWGSAVFTLEAFDANDPPIMIFHGTYDTTVPVISALTIQAQCKSLGIPHRAYLISGGGHGCWDCTYDGKTLTTLTLEFLREFMP